MTIHLGQFWELLTLCSPGHHSSRDRSLHDSSCHESDKSLRHILCHQTWGPGQRRETRGSPHWSQPSLSPCSEIISSSMDHVLLVHISGSDIVSPLRCFIMKAQDRHSQSEASIQVRWSLSANQRPGSSRLLTTITAVILIVSVICQLTA